MGIKTGDISLPMAMMNRDGALYDAAGKGMLGVLPKMDYDRRQKKVVEREQAAAAEAQAEKERKERSEQWASSMTPGFKKGGSVKGWGKARGARACKGC